MIRFSTMLVLSVVSVLLAIGCKRQSTEPETKPSAKRMETSKMSPNTLAGKKVLFIIAANDFRDEELFEPQAILDALDAQTTIASSSLGTSLGMLGGQADATVTIDSIEVDDYDAIVFVGGTGSSQYFDNPAAHCIARDAVAKGKLLCAICIAPSTLANAGVLKGKRATSWPSQLKHLAEQGAQVVSKPVVLDGTIITAVGPEAAKQFGETIAEQLAK